MACFAKKFSKNLPILARINASRLCCATIRLPTKSLKPTEHGLGNYFLIRKSSTSTKSDEMSARNLMNFFDDKTNWNATASIIVGRNWKKAELRTRSNEDLHKLWYVLLKEMNMLLTMKEAYHARSDSFSTENRLEKVEVSMDNLWDVIEERDRAISLLETGEEPHPRWIDDMDELGRDVRRLEEEFPIPKEENEEFLKRYDNIDWPVVEKMKALYREKVADEAKECRKEAEKLCEKLLKKYPHLHSQKEQVMEYCTDQVTPMESNPDVEQLIKQDREKDDLFEPSYYPEDAEWVKRV